MSQSLKPIERKMYKLKIIKKLPEIIQTCSENELKEILIQMIYEDYELQHISQVADNINDINFGNCYRPETHKLLEINPLIFACIKKRFDLVKYFVENKNADINTLSKNKTTPIMFSAEHSDYKTMVYLHQKGALLKVGDVKMDDYIIKDDIICTTLSKMFENDIKLDDNIINLMKEIKNQ